MKKSVKSLLLLPCLLAVPACGLMPQSLPPRVAVAAENPTSSITGIAIPRGPVALESDIAPFTKLLNDVAAVEAVNLKPAGDEAEVWVWENEWGGEGRGAFTQSAVLAALKTGGYTTRELTPNDVGAVSLFGAFDSEELAFTPSMTGVTNYFVATNEAKGSAIVGAWIGGKNKLALGLLPVAFKAKPKAKPLPAAASGAIVVKNFDDTMASFPRPVAPKFAPMERKPRMVRGWLKDTGGRPVANAEVAVHSSVGGGLRTTHKARSNAQGLYEVMVPTGIAEVVQVDKDVSYNDKTYNLHLNPATGHAKQFNSKDGHVENYVLSVAGKSGGTIRFTDDFEKGTVEITLTPVGRMMDGSAGHTLIYRVDTGESRIETYLNGVPLGRYKMKARLFDEGEVLPLRLRRTSGTDAERSLKDEEVVDFQNGFNYIPSNTNNGVAYFEVSVAP